MYQALRLMGALAIAGLMASFPGCFGPSDDNHRVGAVDWNVPTWEVGDYWVFEGPDGNTERLTVAGMETKTSRAAYRLDLLITDPSIGAIHGTTWIAVDNLASLGLETRYNRIDEDCGAVFPLENRTAPCFVHTSGEPDYRANWTAILAQPERVTTPAGSFLAVSYSMFDFEGDMKLHFWYSDAVGYRVQYEVYQGPFMKLIEWSYDPRVGQ